jgi:hypothetical protein
MKRPGIGVGLLIGATVLMMIAVVVVTLIPLRSCPVCGMINYMHVEAMTSTSPYSKEAHLGDDVPVPASFRTCPGCPKCTFCKGRGKRTLLEEWVKPINWLKD